MQHKNLLMSYPFFNMVRLGGFEPSTARFVAEYSIQLSYSRMMLCLLLSLFSSLKLMASGLIVARLEGLFGPPALTPFLTIGAVVALL